MKLISTDKQTARDLRRLVASADAGGSSSSAVSTITSPVIAKVVSAISAGDHTQKTARLMTISGGAIVATGQTVRIRNVGSGAVAADTVVLTEPCGKLGQCFCKQLESAPVISTAWSRGQAIVGPLNSNAEIAGFTTPWVYSVGYFLTGLVPYATTPFWQLKWSTSITATPATVSTLNPRYVAKMAPIRFRVGDSSYADFVSRNTRNVFSRNRVETAFRDLSPASAGHCGDAVVTKVIVTPPIGTIYTTQLSGVKYVRMMVNSVDVTGIVSVNSLASNAGSLVVACSPITLTIAPTVITSDDIVEFDYWFEMSCTKKENFFEGQLLPATREQAAIVGACPNSWYPPRLNLTFRAVFDGLNPQAKRGSGDLYSLSFSDNGPGGVSHLILQPQDDWEFQQTTTTMIQMTKTAGTGTGDRIWFNWGREIPEITINKQITSPVVALFMRYLPASSGNYEQIDGASTPGVWDPQASTSFSVKGVEAPNMTGGVGYMDSSVYPAQYFAAYPTSITVEKV